MSSKCAINVIFMTIFLIIIVNGYAKDISGVERGRNRLNEYISHYETLNYDHESLKASHRRARRSVTKDHIVHLKFSAHGRHFHLRLKRDVSTFNDNLEIIDSRNEPIEVNTDHIYEGEVIGDGKSYVFGSILDGVFEGKIITDRDAYYVEHAKRYFPMNHTQPIASKLQADYNFTPATNTTASGNITYNSPSDSDNKVANDHITNVGFHSVIYKDAHVEDAYKHMREGHVGGCGITEEVSNWMENIQNSAVEDLPEENDEDTSNTDKLKKTLPPQESANGANDDFAYPYEKYTKEANFRFADEHVEVRKLFEKAASQVPPKSDNRWHERVHERMRRAAATGNGSSRREDNKNTCSLYIQTDPLIWRHIREGIALHDHKYETDVKTREEITSLIAHHVTAVNYIYRNTKFDGRNEHRNIRFEVQRIKIDDDTACRSDYNGNYNAFCNEHMDVSNFLNLHSLVDHSDFCLAYVFTYRDFTGGTLGLAWVASASGASGGICEKYKTYTETVGGQYQSTKRSLNTGIITFVNYNSRVPPKVSQLTLAHEIGHNFGSPHDYPQECRPGGLNGNYIMFASATSGDRPNNSKFSPCSVRNISNVLDVLVGNLKRDCFKASEGAFCGNKIVESGEECDCGFNEEECKDKCCYPRIITEYDMSLNSSAHGCRRRRLTQCSPSEGPCCLADSCNFVPFNYQQKCKEETECSWYSYCNGTSAECPKPKPRENNTKCNNGTALCNDGECSGSICKLWNMSECFLNSQSSPQLDKRKLCELACQNGNDTGTCRSTSEFAHMHGLPEGGISLRPGSPCDNFQGYCDVFLKCRAVDADGPLVRLKNLLLNRETLLTVAQWVTENWYMVVLMGIGFIIVMGIFIKCCAVHTPSSNPKKRRARRISETLRAPMNTLRRMRQHPHGRGGGMARSVPVAGHHHSSHGHHHRNGVSGVVAGGRHHVPGRSSSGGGAGRSSRALHSGRSQESATSRNVGQVGATAAAGFVVGAGAASAAAGGAALSRAQLPLPPVVQQQQPQSSAAFYAPPKVVPQPVNYGRPSSMHNHDLYADAYAAMGRSAYGQIGELGTNAKV